MSSRSRIGVLTAGGDCPGLNAAIRAIGKAALGTGKFRVLGFKDGFRGLAQNSFLELDHRTLSGILTVGGTILGTSRDRPHKIEIDGVPTDMTDAIVQNYRKHKLSALVCIGGGGTQKSALRLAKLGLNVITLPKTIDNDIPHTDTAIGFDTALSVATEAIDRLHSTAHSHHRIVIVELMGHRAGWLALGAGIAGGADVILIPEIPFDVYKVAAAIEQRKARGSPFSIVAVAEGATPVHDLARLIDPDSSPHRRKNVASEREALYRATPSEHTLRLALALERLTGLESRVTILGYVQRGGSPTANDRLLATKLGTAAVEAIVKGNFGIMLAVQNDRIAPVALELVANRRKEVTPEHPWVLAARALGTCLGD